MEFFSGGASYSRAVEMTFREVAAAEPEVLEGALSLLSNLYKHHELELAALTLSFLTQQPQHRDSGHEAQTLGICAVTVATAFKPALARLNASLAANGIELFVLGMGMKWRGHGLKLLLLERFLAVEDNNLISKARYSHVLFLDAYDTLVLEMATPRLILSRFLAFGAGVVFNGETECAPDPQLQQAFWTRNHHSLPPLPYLNSGVYLGDVETIRRMLDEVFVDMRTSFGLRDFDGMSKADDQRFLSRTLCTGFLRMILLSRQKSLAVALSGPRRLERRLSCCTATVTVALLCSISRESWSRLIGHQSTSDDWNRCIHQG
jgi:hypothetical protein